jgi:hypothetical protein
MTVRRVGDGEGDMSPAEFDKIRSAITTKIGAASCPACKQPGTKRGTLPSFVALAFASTREGGVSGIAASFVASVCTHCGHTWFFHGDTLLGEHLSS